MNPHRLWIRAVNGLTPEQEPLCRSASANRGYQWLIQSSAWTRIRYLEHREVPLCIDNWDGHQRWWNPKIEKATFTVNHHDQSLEDHAVSQE